MSLDRCGSNQSECIPACVILLSSGTAVCVGRVDNPIKISFPTVGFPVINSCMSDAICMPKI